MLAALRQRAGEARGCYERALKEDPKLAGRAVVRLRIREDGNVDSVQIQNSEISNAGFADCLTSLLRAPLSVGPQGGCVNVALPLNFQPKTQPDGGVTGN